MSTFATDDLEVLRNRTFDEVAIGDRASIERTLTAADIQLFAAMSGDINPQHIEAEFAASTRFHDVIAHGMWGAALISASRSRVRVAVEPTDEEWIAATHARRRLHDGAAVVRGAPSLEAAGPLR